jgi:biopolymer transport protein ExbD
VKMERRPVKRGRIELIPLIDTILMLLIFYMTFGKLVKEESKLDASLPVITQSSQADVGIAMTVEVLGQGRLLINKEEQTVQGFVGVLSGLALAADTVSIVLKGRDTASYQEVIDVLNVCAKNGIKNISFITNE